jgi:hypothetical protein
MKSEPILSPNVCALFLNIQRDLAKMLHERVIDAFALRWESQTMPGVNKTSSCVSHFLQTPRLNFV